MKKSKAELEQFKLQRMEEAPIPGRSNQPVGLAQIGWACFWPKGGGLLPPGANSKPPVVAEPGAAPGSDASTTSRSVPESVTPMDGDATARNDAAQTLTATE